MDLLAQVLEKVAEVTIKVEQQHEHLAAISTKADQQQERLTAINTKADQQQRLAAMSVMTDQQRAKMEQHLAALPIKIDQQQADLNALGLKTRQQITELRKDIPQEVQQQVQQWLENIQEQQVSPMQQQLEKLDERLNNVERRSQIVINQMPYNTGHAMVMFGKPSTFKIPTFDGTGPCELYHKRFEAATAHNQWANIEIAIVLTVHLNEVAWQVLEAMRQSDTIWCATLVNCLEQGFGQKYLAPMKRWYSRIAYRSWGKDYKTMEQTTNALPKRLTQAWIQNLWRVLQQTVSQVEYKIGKYNRQSACTPARASLQHWFVH